MTLVGKRYHPPGTPPGTLTSAAEEPAFMRYLHYHPGSVHTTDEPEVDAIPHPPVEGAVGWLEITGTPSAQQLQQILDRFDVHALALEDVLNQGQRPKLDREDGYLFCILNWPSVAIDAQELTLQFHQVSLFLLDNLVISCAPQGTDCFSAVRNRIERTQGKLRSHSGSYLLYALIDTVVDQAFPVLEALGTQIETLEEAVLEGRNGVVLGSIHRTRRELIVLRHRLCPQREVMRALLHDSDDWFQPTERIYLSDCQDHCIQLMDLLETYHEMTRGLLEIYLSEQNNRMGEVMRVLTVIATLFIPLTFLVGVYGMNFSISDSPWAMPELRWKYAYPALWVLMASVAAGMLIGFKKRGWL